MKNIFPDLVDPDAESCGPNGCTVKKKIDVDDDLPVIPALPPESETWPKYPGGPIAKCGQCGIKIYQVMGYVCPHPRCPTGLGLNR